MLTVRIGRKYCIYLPSSIVKSLGLSEGDRLVIEVRGREIVLKPVPKLLERRSFWSETTIEEFERESEELTEILESG